MLKTRFPSNINFKVEPEIRDLIDRKAEREEISIAQATREILHAGINALGLGLVP